MFAIVESGSITSMPRGNKGVEINGVKHPVTIFTLWTESERNAIGVYTVQIDDTNKKDYDDNDDIITSILIILIPPLPLPPLQCICCYSSSYTT